ncbi:MAG: TatD family hydrolase [Bacilli bacterium]|jgi:TatD DNase family protein|nr:TatD family hydrolase [Bacilli bacterium]
MIIDTHIHLYDEKYKNELKQLIWNAQNKDVGKMIVVGFDLESSKQAIAMANEYPFLYASIGIHPSEVNKLENDDLNWIIDFAQNKKVVAIGEIGLDYYWDKTYIEKQKEFFIMQIKIAKQLDLPIIVHNREATKDTYDILNANLHKGVLHCYSGSLEMAQEFIKLGYYLGIGGVLTFKNSKEIKRVVSEVNLDYLLSETDGPYLAPSPFRGEVNKPEYLPIILKAISELKLIDYEIVLQKLQKNAERLFHI